MIADLKEPKAFDTIGKRAKFTLHSIEGKITFVSEACKDCIVYKSQLRKVYECFVKKKSWKTEDYRNSRHASYFLRLLKEYFKACEKRKT